LAQLVHRAKDVTCVHKLLESEPSAFATAGARLWNSLPTDIVACECGTLPEFRQ